MHLKNNFKFTCHTQFISRKVSLIILEMHTSSSGQIEKEKTNEGRIPKNVMNRTQEESSTETPTIQLPSTPTSHCQNNHMTT